MKKLALVLGVSILTFSVALAVDEGFKVGPLRLSLWGEFSGTYDDNARLVVPDGEIQDRQIFDDLEDAEERKQEDDIFFETSLGGRLYRQTDDFLGSLMLIYSDRRYDEFSDLDNDSFHQEAEVVFGDRAFDRMTLGLRQSYREVFDYENVAYPDDDFVNTDTRGVFLSEDRTERVSRELIDMAGILTWRISDKLDSDYTVAYGSIDYDTELLFDWSDIKGQAEFDYKLTEKTSALLTGQYGQQESDSLENKPDYYVIRAGALTRTTDKLTFKGGVGAGRYDRFRKSQEALDQAAEQGEILEEESDAIDYLAFDVAGDWDLTQRTKLQIIGRNAVQPAAQYTDNAKLVTVASVGIAHRIREKFRLAGTVSYRNDDYEDPVEIDTDEFIDQEDTIWGGQIRLDYLPPDGYLNVYAELRYENRDTTLPNEDYDQIRATLGIKLKI